MRTSSFGEQTERVGFEPTVPLGTHAFQTCPFGRSGTSPKKQDSRSQGVKGQALESWIPRILDSYPQASLSDAARLSNLKLLDEDQRTRLDRVDNALERHRVELDVIVVNRLGRHILAHLAVNHEVAAQIDRANAEGIFHAALR